MKNVFFLCVLFLSAIAVNAGVAEVKSPDVIRGAAPAPAAEVHMSGTMTSSCGVVWNFTYDCYSGCTFSGTVNNIAALQTAINNACGTSTTSISLTFPAG